MAEGYVQPRYNPKRLVLAEGVRGLIQSVAEIPPLALLFRTSVYLYAALLAFTRMGIQRRRGGGLLLILLAYGVGLCFVPISGSVRYAFPIFAAAPILCLISLGMPRRKSNSRRARHAALQS